MYVFIDRPQLRVEVYMDGVATPGNPRVKWHVKLSRCLIEKKLVIILKVKLKKKK